MPKIKLDKTLFEQVKEYADKEGYSSADEFVVHLLEQVVNAADSDDQDEDVMQRLKGLGYIS
jgi:metal-responsive CopG/Arc/MetJ family transcriptional regulator